MMISPSIRRLLAVASMAMAGSLFAAEAPKSNAADARKLAAEVNAKRTEMIKDHDALVKQLKDASEAQRQEILAKLAELKKNFEETLNALHKAQREDDRKRRQNAAPGRR